MYLDSQSGYFGILGYTIIYFKMTASNPVYPETSEKEGSFALVNTTAFCSKIISRLNIANDSSWYCTEYSPNSSLACFRGILSLRSTQQWKNPKIPLTRQPRILSVFLSLKGMCDHALLACCSTQIFHI